MVMIVAAGGSSESASVPTSSESGTTAMGWQSQLFPELDEALCTSLEKPVHGLNTENRWKRRSSKSILKQNQFQEPAQLRAKRQLFVNLYSQVPYGDPGDIARSVRFTSLALVVRENRVDDENESPVNPLFYNKRDFQDFRQQDMDLVQHISTTEDSSFLREHSLAGMEYKLATFEQQDARKEAQKASLQSVFDLQREYKKQERLLQRQLSRRRRSSQRGNIAKSAAESAIAALQDSFQQKIADAYQSATQPSTTTARHRARTLFRHFPSFSKTNKQQEQQKHLDPAEVALCEHYRQEHKKAMAQLLLQKIAEEVQHRQYLMMERLEKQEGIGMVPPPQQEHLSPDTSSTPAATKIVAHPPIGKTTKALTPSSVSLRSLLLAQRRSSTDGRTSQSKRVSSSLLIRAWLQQRQQESAARIVAPPVAS